MPLVNSKHVLRLADRGLDFANWYPKAIKEIKTVCDSENWDIARFIAVLAVTSPRCSIRRNVRIALNYLHNGELFPNIMRGIRASLDHWEESGDIRGPKTSAFARALSGDKSAIVLDVHMANAFEIPQKQMYLADNWERCEETVLNTSRKLGIAPRDTQACIWAGSFRQSQRYSPGYFPIAQEYRIFQVLGKRYPIDGSIDRHVKTVRRRRFDARQFQFSF